MNEEKLDFGGSRLFENFPWIIGLIFFIASMGIFFYFTSYLQLLSLPLILLSANFFIGTYVTRNFSKSDNMTLPFVDLFNTDDNIILDAGCGSGRATIELSKVFKGKIVAFDLFDPKGESISSRNLLEKNLEIAKITDRVQIVQGDVTNIEFEDNTFDAAISSLLINNLGKSKQTALKELFRVLKPRGKILIIVPSRNLQTFAVMSVFSLVLTSTEKWHYLFNESGFQILDEGFINFGKFFLLQK
ncbi:class I SAM-dependent methyltransferase [Methanobacterium alcaliphilum]|uniref:class I SAM-dependent methyltransferase n=1 Tax=Methanobacterium alcaliphilum TaxID=392018 RepID=UPI00200A6567|nr:class I SAM-dependent methyltransferase [Methanobacterium alcaliphilum]MCK9151371.1 class I SAM-dependent methyltransferase [Methanobacterium alcaliphilum]